jgi:hypothetical protein
MRVPVPSHCGQIVPEVETRPHGPCVPSLHTLYTYPRMASSAGALTRQVAALIRYLNGSALAEQGYIGPHVDSLHLCEPAACSQTANKVVRTRQCIVSGSSIYVHGQLTLLGLKVPGFISTFFYQVEVSWQVAYMRP